MPTVEDRIVKQQTVMLMNLALSKRHKVRHSEQNRRCGTKRCDQETRQPCIILRLWSTP